MALCLDSDLRLPTWRNRIEHWRRKNEASIQIFLALLLIWTNLESGESSESGETVGSDEAGASDDFCKSDQVNLNI